jgi:MFS family permease
MQQTTAASTGGAPTAIAPGAWPFLGFMMVLNILNILDRQLLPTFANEIIDELKLSNAEFGLLTGILFTLMYGILSPFMGVIADSTHRPRFAAVGLALWSALTAASGAAGSFMALAIPRVLIGVGESTLTPTALSMISSRFPTARLGLATGIYYAGVPLGAGAAYMVASTLAPLIGWRNCFFVLGGLGIVLALILFTFRETRPPAQGGAGERIKGMLSLAPEAIGLIVKTPTLLFSILGAVLLHVAVGAAQFDARWWRVELDLELGPLFLKIALIYATVGVAGNVIGGALGDWWQRTTGQGRPMLLVWMFLVLSPIGFFYRLVDGENWIFWLGIAAGIFQLGTLYGPVLGTVQELTPTRIRATAVAMFIMAVNVIGLGISVTAAGYLIDWFADMGRERPITDMMIVLNAVSLLAIPSLFIAARSYKRDRERLGV